MNEIDTDLRELGQRLWPDASALHPRGQPEGGLSHRRRSVLMAILVGTTTAAIVVAVLTAGVLLLGHSRAHKPVEPLPRATEPASIAALDMLTATSGWGWNTHLISRTTDGAATFTNATPGGLTSGQTIANLTAVDMRHAWAVIASQTQIQTPTPTIVTHAWLYRTADGGVTWKSAPINPRALGLMFVDAQHGWATVYSTPPAGRLELMRTVDGGVTWSPVYETTFVDGNPCEFSPTFVTPAFGVATFGGCETPSMAMTTDGGFTWRRIALPNPARGKEPAMITQVDAISFTSPNSGSVFLTVCPPSEGFCDASGSFYRTTDGGATWSQTAAIRSGDLEILAPATAWAPGACLMPCLDDNGTSRPNQLLVTADDGEHWTAEPMPVFAPQPNLLAFQFVNPRVGFVVNIFGGHPVGVSETFTYYRTSDAGKTWVEFRPLLRG
jgi:photosystem II stability/assembly factor-like uncharacterized protein